MWLVTDIKCCRQRVNCEGKQQREKDECTFAHVFYIKRLFYMDGSVISITMGSIILSVKRVYQRKRSFFYLGYQKAKVQFYLKSPMIKIEQPQDQPQRHDTNPDKSFDTFRGQSAASRKKQNLNETLPTVLDASNIRTHSPTGILKASNIRCPIYGPDQVYHCEICSQLRLVCPHRSGAAGKFGGKRDGIGKNIQGSVHINTEINEMTKVEEEMKKNIGKFIPGRTQTPQFQSFKDLDIKFANSLPYIKNPEGTDRTFINNLTSQTKITETLHTSLNQGQGQAFIRHQTPIPQRPIHFHQQPTTYLTPARPKQIVEQIIFQPIVHNVIVPRYVDVNTNGSNPERTVRDTPKRQYYEERSGQKFVDSQYSPVNGSRFREYNEKGVMTPENFKKLADSMIR